VNTEKEPKVLDIGESQAVKFNVEEFDPKPLEPEDLEGDVIPIRSVPKESLKIKDTKSKSPKPEKSPDQQISALRSAMTAFSLVGQIGLIMFVSVAIGLIGGMYLDRWLGTGHLLMIILTLLGVASGFRTVYIMVKKLIN